MSDIVSELFLALSHLRPWQPSGMTACSDTTRTCSCCTLRKDLDVPLSFVTVSCICNQPFFSRSRHFADTSIDVQCRTHCVFVERTKPSAAQAKAERIIGVEDGVTNQREREPHHLSVVWFSSCRP